MAEANISVAEDQFNCSICLDLLREPVTIPCGHSYCMNCITDYWNQNDQRRVYSCPQCRETFTPRPALNKNVMFAEIVQKLRGASFQTAPALSYAGPGDVECDVCTERKYKAVKSCLACLQSYCQTHFERHEEFHSGRHKVTKATGQLKQMICPKHDKLLEVYCRTDQKCICLLCTVDEHKNHDTVSTTSERTDIQKQLEETQAHFQQKIQEREKRMQELKDAVKTNRHLAQAAEKDSEEIFAELIRFIERSRSEVIWRIRNQEKDAKSEVEGLLKELEQEIEDLKWRNTELEQLLHTDDHIHFLQRFQSLCEPSKMTDISRANVSSVLLNEDVGRSVSQLKEKLEQFCKEEIENIFYKEAKINRAYQTEPKTRKDFLQYFLQLSLDRNTAHQSLCLSEGNTVATYTHTAQHLPDHPDRFTNFFGVLCRESVSGRCYWEVESIGNERLYGVGVAVSYKSINRKGTRTTSGFGYNDQSWKMICSRSRYIFWHNNIKTKLPALFRSSRIGVYVDHRAGVLSFFSVSDTTMNLIHRVQTTFTQPLYPGFWIDPGSRLKICRL
ncbi:finTRIM family, member 24 [Danio rerio]|uniref:FinTRIM family, member 24 n=1 Tax=Danio rerio TaxID=7955 RepID=B0S6R8_DANRE|nr:finTRIM family, member 24 [Danio rerio]|eukprot:XP_017207758.1 tripartite motif-containing protein 16-like [Danio rerio]